MLMSYQPSCMSRTDLRKVHACGAHIASVEITLDKSGGECMLLYGAHKGPVEMRS